jgi:hypothetical protein
MIISDAILTSMASKVKLAAPEGRLCSAGTLSPFHDHNFIQTNREKIIS